MHAVAPAENPADTGAKASAAKRIRFLLLYRLNVPNSQGRGVGEHENREHSIVADIFNIRDVGM